MKVTLAEWIDLQKKQIRVCNAPEEKLPQVIFIGKPSEDGMIEVYMKLADYFGVSIEYFLEEKEEV